ncbi:MAG: hypothetical protein HWD62_03305 [Cyclobacteriaceae bacterium]|nr:MAG: hypothetical protein HWD62_03305 [Cyclobacteriaceae bacterium]
MRVNNNRLAIAPQSLRSLSQLENLDLSANQLSELPEGIGNLPALKLLVVVNNPWNELSRNQISAMARILRDKEVIVHVEEN